MAKFRNRFQEHPEYQLQEQSLRAGLSPERLAIPNIAIQKLKEKTAGKEMDHNLVLKRLGLQRKGQKQNLELGNLRYGLALDRFHFRKAQARSAETVAKYGMALNTALGIGDFMQDLKYKRKLDRILSNLEGQENKIRESY